ncbi:hypothetical protein GUJ93_ZPchr0010g7321 [Zizania palustris]|uniref:F-box domain-containing protein n=1 Tax=Zizania palustris TaxID=103762 RepID=A0A8J6BHD0_ZIZPA|nr:hypothetical protein GUJ93_ZPchr0010g7321 [Zizania palustris]
MKRLRESAVDTPMSGSPRKRMLLASPAQDSCTDRLSALPNELILHIMSFMNARVAVRTCVLSRRWLHLWRSVPRVNAEFFEFEGATQTQWGDEVAFKRFINRLLELRDPLAPIDKFWLRYSVDEAKDQEVACADANRWISHALQKNAQSVEVVVVDGTLLVDHVIFTSRFLTRIGFSTVLLDKGFFKQLQTGCPALEDVFLHDCIFVDDEIFSQTLKILNIEISHFSEECQHTISTPTVTFLNLCCPTGRLPLLMDMPSLLTASVCFNGGIYYTPTDVQQSLRSLSCVTSLDFNYEGNKLSIQNNMQWCPEFINLVNLTLGQWCLDANFYGLIVFLQNSPRLEKLTLEFEKSRWIESEPETITGDLKERSFTCERLKIVEVICRKDELLVNRVEEFFSNSGMTSLQISIKHWDQIRHYEPEFVQI